MRIPKFLKPGDTIGITAPSFGATTEPYVTRFKEAVRLFKQEGFKIKIGSTCRKHDGLGISTKPEIAAKELEDFYLDSQVDAIISCGGGELMCETVGFLDFEKIKKARPKWFMGYSDNTNFEFPLATICNTASIYGHCISGFGKPWEESEKESIALLTGSSKSVQGFEKFQLPEVGTEAKEANPISSYICTEKKVLRNYLPVSGGLKKIKSTEEIKIKGTLLGGCLDVLENLCGTKLDAVKAFKKKHEKIIWVLEACDYNPMGIRRAMWHLDQCGWFEQTAGFVIGRPLASFRSEMMGVDSYNAVTDIVSKYRVPVIMDADVGHIAPTMPLVIGAEALVEAKGNKISVTFDI